MFSKIPSSLRAQNHFGFSEAPRYGSPLVSVCILGVILGLQASPGAHPSHLNHPPRSPLCVRITFSSRVSNSDTSASTSSTEALGKGGTGHRNRARGPVVCRRSTPPPPACPGRVGAWGSGAEGTDEEAGGVKNCPPALSGSRCSARCGSHCGPGRSRKGRRRVDVARAGSC